MANMKTVAKTTTKVWGWEYPPYSTDPIDYDDVVHHLAWTSVYGTLVTEYKVGQFTGQLAKAWDSENNFTEWTFRIRPNCYFENGEPITPYAIAQSIKRIALVQKKRGSHSGLLENIIGLSNLEKTTSDIAGIQFDEQSITLKFTKPMPDLLSKIGFGLYSVTHPSQYEEDGTWKDKRSIISSGAYKIQAWSEKTLELSINEKQESCFSWPTKPLTDIEVVFGSENIDISQQHIVSGSSNSLMIDSSFSFLGPSASDILYIRSYKSLEPRISAILRDVIISEMSLLNNINFTLNRSFLPLTVKGTSPAKITPRTDEDLALIKGLSLRIPQYAATKKSLNNQNVLSYTEAFSKVMEVLRLKYKVNIVELPMDYSSFTDTPKRASLYDLELLLTGVLVENPYEDIVFMFKSKEGIQLPDRNGAIFDLLNDAQKNIAQINQAIWDQGLIIPITHYSSGLWVKKDLFNTQDLNHMLPPTNFQFIGRK